MRFPCFPVPLVDSQLAGSAQLPYFKKLGVNGELYQSYGTVASTPWSLKAAIGLLSDTIPLFGYHKKYYIIFVSILGTASFAALGFLKMSASVAAFLLLLGNLQLATVDLLCEGKYAEKMVEHPESGSDLVSLVWGLVNLGQFAGSVLAGPIADHGLPRYIFLICLPLAAQVIIPTACGALPDAKVPVENRGIRMDKIRKHPQLFKLSIAMTLGSLAVGLSALVPGGTVQASVSFATSVLLAIVGSMWLPRMLGNANLYMFLSSASYLSISGAVDYFFTGHVDCIADGPHFPYTYYITYTAIASSIAGMAGVSIFQAYLSRGKFRTAFWCTCLVKLAASLFDIAIVKRINIRLGVPDKVAFLIGDAIIFSVASMLDFMPAVTLTSKLCPKGMEASVYALLASYQNLGSSVGRSLGVALIEVLGIKTPTKGKCNFDNLPLAIFIAHFLLPLVVIPLVFVLIPDANMTEDLLTDEQKGNEYGRVDTAESDSTLSDEVLLENEITIGEGDTRDEHQ